MKYLLRDECRKYSYILPSISIQSYYRARRMQHSHGNCFFLFCFLIASETDGEYFNGNPQNPKNISKIIKDKICLLWTDQV